MALQLSDDAKKIMNEIYREFVRSMDLAMPGVSEEEAIASLKKLQANAPPREAESGAAEAHHKTRGQHAKTNRILDNREEAEKARQDDHRADPGTSIEAKYATGLLRQHRHGRATASKSFHRPLHYPDSGWH